jgi:pantoate--beta-alanine ligase
MTATLTLARTREELAEALPVPAVGRTRVGFVPTMGALHAGHASLIRTARGALDAGSPVVVSIFVNPLQFGQGEDLDRYPRTFDADLELCAAEGVDVVFAPSVDEVYPGGQPQVTVDPGPMASVLEGASRPTHFAGVLTVVAKLFGLVRPDVAVFGEKDYQQLALIRRMASDLCLGVEVLGSPTVREGDGLALSSRNAYLDAEARQAATALSRALFAGQAAALGGRETTLAAADAVLRGARGVDADYVALTAPDLGPAPDRGEARLLVAARVGGTRLIDNVPVQLGGEN